MHLDVILFDVFHVELLCIWVEFINGMNNLSLQPCILSLELNVGHFNLLFIRVSQEDDQFGHSRELRLLNRIVNLPVKVRR